MSSLGRLDIFIVLYTSQLVHELIVDACCCLVVSRKRVLRWKTVNKDQIFNFNLKLEITVL
jgi:hypothetical protein